MRMTIGQQKRAFAKLSQALTKTKLPCENGPHRWAKADEFMLMGMNTSKEWMFKHCDTRNYVYVCNCVGELRIPMTDEPFKLGYFDQF